MILVTGGTGLLGSHLLLELVREHEEVVAIKRPSSNLEEVKSVFSYYSNEADHLFKLIDWVDVDLLYQQDMERVMIDIEEVYHCAAMVSFQPRDRKSMIDFNVQSTTNVVNACLEAGVKKLVHVSSSSAIGRAPDGQPADESRIWARSKYSSGYAESKFKSEMEIWRGMEEGLNAVIVNPTIIFGSGFWDRGSSSMFSRVAGGLKYATPGVTGYVGVNDVVAAMTQLMASDILGERFILSAGDHSYQEVFETIGATLEVPRKLKQVSPAMLRSICRLDAFMGLFTGKRRITSEHLHSAFSMSYYSSKKIQETLGIEFTPVPQVIERVAQNYRQNHPL